MDLHATVRRGEKLWLGGNAPDFSQLAHVQNGPCLGRGDGPSMPDAAAATLRRDVEAEG
jgi:hypothetical protein